MNKLTISYGALGKHATIEIHRENKILILRKQLDNVSMDEVIADVSNVLKDQKEKDVIIYFNGTPSDFAKLQSSKIANDVKSIYHSEKYEDIMNRLELMELAHLEIQNSPYPLSESKEREYIDYGSSSDIFSAGYCLLEHIGSQRQRLIENLLYSNNFSYQFADMLRHYYSWLDDLHGRLYKLLD